MAEAGQETQKERLKRLVKEQDEYINNKTSPNHRRVYEIDGLGSLRKEMKRRRSDARYGFTYEPDKDGGKLTDANHRNKKVKLKTLIDE